MKRGELWTVAGGSDFLSKPRPAVIIRMTEAGNSGSATLCPISSFSPGESLFRPHLEPSERNGLIAPSVAKVDLITTVRMSRLGRQIGRLDTGEMARVERAIVLYLGLENSI